MWMAIFGGVAKIGSAIASLFNAAIKWAAVGLAYMAGKKKAENKALKEAAEVKDEQLEIMSKPTRHRRTLLDRMRRRERDE